MTKAELERVYEAEVVQEDGDILQACVSEWSSAASTALVAKLRQARAAAIYIKERRSQGLTARDAVKEFAGEVRAEKSKVYNYTRVWWIYGHLLEDGNSSFSSRVESGVLTMTHLVEASRAGDPAEMIDAAEDDELSSRAIKARIEEEREEEGASDPRVTKVETMRCPICDQCPRCHGEGVVPVEGGE